MRTRIKNLCSSLCAAPVMLSNHMWTYCQYFLLYFRSLFGNHHINQSYVIDACMEPMYWVVDNFVVFIGPAFVVLVVTLTSFVVFLSYWIGVPFYWHKSPALTCVLIVVGNWILLNYVFHYYMGVTTMPGYPPQSPALTCVLIVVGNWILLNYVFHYYMGVTTMPGYPPQ
ncbi:palmitoyltransferase ZDHHC16A-like, partial [Diaphorina citri]|uniref:Palmitoyltransferase ZDHHC16A-like n=1 Tax=Diaphorina citri TaxID=121845 RepID=A0A3Q0JMG3_DIACI